MQNLNFLREATSKFQIGFSYEKLYFYSIIIFAFTMPISRASISFFIIFFPLIWLIEGDFKRKISEIKSSKILLTFLIFYIIIAISALLSDNEKTALKFFRLYAYWLTMIVLATSMKKEWLKPAITAFLCGMLVSELVAYGIFFGIWEYGVGSKVNPSPFMFHIDYSVYLAFTSVLLFSRIISKDYNIKEKILLALFFTSTTTNLFLQTGRTGQVAYIVAVFVMFLLTFRLNFKSIAYAIFSLALIYTLAFNFSNSFNMRVNHTITELKLIASGKLNSSWGQRIGFFEVTFETLKEYPLFGIGLGDFEEEAAKTMTKPEFDGYTPQMKEFMSSNHFHNQFLMCAMQMGIIGLAFTLALYILAFLKAFSTPQGQYRNIFVLFMVIYTIGSFADPLWNKQFTGILWIFVVSMMIAFNKNDKENLFK